MSTAQAHVTAAELAQLNKPKRSGQYWAGTIAGLAGIAFIIIYCILPFYWMIVSSLRLPTDGRSTDFLPNPASLEKWHGQIVAWAEDALAERLVLQPDTGARRLTRTACSSGRSDSARSRTPSRCNAPANSIIAS